MINFFVEILFVISGGSAIATTWMLLPYVFLMVMILFGLSTLTLFFANKGNIIISVTLVCAVAFSFFILMGSPLRQQQYMTDCYTSPATVMSDDGYVDATVKNCRYRDNRFDDFGEYKIQSVILK